MIVKTRAFRDQKASTVVKLNDVSVIFEFGRCFGRERFQRLTPPSFTINQTSLQGFINTKINTVLRIESYKCEGVSHTGNKQPSSRFWTWKLVPVHSFTVQPVRSYPGVHYSAQGESTDVLPAQRLYILPSASFHSLNFERGLLASFTKRVDDRSSFSNANAKTPPSKKHQYDDVLGITVHSSCSTLPVWRTSMPPCVSTCAASASGAVGCNGLDLVCVCSSTSFFPAAQACMTVTCSPQDAASGVAFFKSVCGAIIPSNEPLPTTPTPTIPPVSSTTPTTPNPSSGSGSGTVKPTGTGTSKPTGSTSSSSGTGKPLSSGVTTPTLQLPTSTSPTSPTSISPSLPIISSPIFSLPTFGSGSNGTNGGVFFTPGVTSTLIVTVPAQNSTGNTTTTRSGSVGFRLNVGGRLDWVLVGSVIVSLWTFLFVIHVTTLLVGLGWTLNRAVRFFC
ncbi:RBT5 family protein [Abortiporus biennis]